MTRIMPLCNRLCHSTNVVKRHHFALVTPSVILAPFVIAGSTTVTTIGFDNRYGVESNVSLL
jgi:hypothetical protein